LTRQFVDCWPVLLLCACGIAVVVQFRVVVDFVCLRGVDTVDLPAVVLIRYDDLLLLYILMRLLVFARYIVDVVMLLRLRDPGVIVALLFLICCC
jgi:hypothetical protein